MSKYFTNVIPVKNIFRKPSNKSEVVNQMLYGDCFKISKKTNKWIKIKTKEDKYNGFIKNKNYSKYTKPTHKICVLKANVYKFSNEQKKINELSINSKIKIKNKKKKIHRICRWLD